LGNWPLIFFLYYTLPTKKETSSPKSVTTSQSDLIQANQTLNMSKRQLKPELNALEGPALETLETVENAQSSAGTSTPL
jgi:hypothetical protein